MAQKNSVFRFDQFVVNSPRSRAGSRFFPAFALAGFVTFSVSTAQNSAPTGNASLIARAVRIDQPPVIDGILDEPIWQTISPITDFKQREPNEGSEPSERTEVRVAYNEHYLYIGLKMFDSDAKLIRATILQRDGRNDQDDRVIIALDTYHDGRNAYIFELNPFGTQGDAIVTDESKANWDWEGVYWSEGKIWEWGWSLEVAIPFTTIRFSESNEPEMGIAFYRSIRRKNEDVYWPLIGLNYKNFIYQASQYATLQGLKGIRRGYDLQVKPYAFTGAQKDIISVSNEIKKGGIDVKYGITSNLTLDLTYNTDFAQVEVDNVQINLTRFSLYYPEKRDFFLEREGIFSFGMAGEVTPFYSRRIGITNEILAGTRLTGQSGAYTIGFMNIQSKDQNNIAGSNYSVARLRTDVADGVTVGTIGTNLQGGLPYNRLLGGDVRLRILGSSEIKGWIANAWTPDNLPSSAAGNVDLRFITDQYRWTFSYVNVGKNFDPGVGFVMRPNMISYRSDASYRPRIGRGTEFVRQLYFTLSDYYTTGQEQDKQSTYDALNVGALLESGDFINVGVERLFERLSGSFPIRPGVIIPAGDYTFNDFVFTLLTNESRTVSGRVGAGAGAFYSGTRSYYSLGSTLKLSKYFSVGGTVSQNNISLPVDNGTFATTIVGVTIFAATSRDLFANGLIQYDNFSKYLQANIRINWIHTPGSNLFVVFNSSLLFPNGINVLDPDYRFFSQAGIVKLTYLIAI